MIALPWPPKELSPNARPHHMQKYKASRRYKSECYILAKGKGPEVNGNIPLLIWFHPPTNRFPDLDNCLAAIKAGVDGVAEAWGINDKIFRPITIDFGEPVKGGKVVMQA